MAALLIGLNAIALVILALVIIDGTNLPANPAEFRSLRQHPDWWASLLERGICNYLAKTNRDDVIQLAPPLVSNYP